MEAVTKEPPAPYTRPVPREVLSVRVLPDHKAALEAFVEELQGEGWTGLKPGHVLEHLMARLLTEEGRAEVRRELAAKG